MKFDERCPCGARITSISLVEKAGEDLIVYTCGVCGTQSFEDEDKEETDK